MLFSNLPMSPCLVVPYEQYVRGFTWDQRKFPIKRSLNELTLSIQKQMTQKDEQMRKNVDEFTVMKNRLQANSKKESGPLTTRDFTDDIYDNKRGLPEDTWVESYGSEMFSNLLMVVHREKYDQVVEALPNLMDKYYEAIDNMEAKRVREAAKNKFNEIMRNHKKYEEAVE